MRRTLFTAVTVALLGLSSHATYVGSGDEPHYLAMAHSLAFDLDLDLSNNYGAAEPLIGDGALVPEAHVRTGAGGVVRPLHDAGMPMLFAPAVRVLAPLTSFTASRLPRSVMRRLRLTPAGLYRKMLGLAMALIAALLACVLFDALQSSGAAPRTALWTAMLVALSPPLLIFSITFFTEVVSALLCLLAFKTIALDRQVTPLRWAAAGAATGLLLLVHSRNVGLVAGLALIAAVRVSREDPRRGAAAFAVPVVVFVALRTALIHHLWGTLVTTPVAAPGEWKGLRTLLGTAATRLGGMLVDQEFGLLPYAPVLALAILGIAAMWRSDRALARSVSVVAGAYLLTIILTITNAVGWTGGWTPAARFLVPIVPLIALGFVPALRVVPRAAVVTLVALQIGLDAYFWQQPKNLWNDGDGVAAICQRGGASICVYLPSFPHH
jgi:hypothetical protein